MAMRPVWDNAKKTLPKTVSVSEKESADIDMNDGVQSFPTLIVYKNGKEVKRIEGARESPSEIVKELGLRRRTAKRGRTHRGKGKLRNRTLRNYKSFA